jgi:hypothetical protein
MNDIFKPIETSMDDIKALRTREAGELFDVVALGRLALVQRMLHNSLTVKNLDTGNHILGSSIAWGTAPGGGPLEREINIPMGGQQRIENFQFMTLWYRQVHVDPPVRLTNNANYACFYEVNKLLGNGMTQQQQIINPWPGASEVYSLDVGQQLHVVPVGMHRYVLTHDPMLKCINPPERTVPAET